MVYVKRIWASKLLLQSYYYYTYNYTYTYIIIITIIKLLLLYQNYYYYHYCTTSFNKGWTQVLRRFKSCLWRVGHSQWWGSLTMVPAGNKAICLLLVNHTTKTINLHCHHHHHHHHHHHQRKHLIKSHHCFLFNTMWLIKIIKEGLLKAKQKMLHNLTIAVRSCIYIYKHVCIYNLSSHSSSLSCVYSGLRAIFMNTKQLPKKQSFFDWESNQPLFFVNKWFFTVSGIWIYKSITIAY